MPIDLPAQVDVKISDNCGNAVVTGAASVLFSNTDPSVVLLPVGNGLWEGTWQPQSGSKVLLSLASVSGQLTATATRTIQIDSTNGAKLPNVRTGAILNAASLIPSVDRVAPGSIISIFGNQLATQTTSVKFPLPIMVGSTQVQIIGNSRTTALPLLYVSPGQINAVVPPGIQLDPSAALVVTTSGYQSIPVPIIPLDSDPGIFGGAVLSAAGAAITPSAPVHHGDFIVIYCTGLGAVSKSLDPSLPSPADPLITAVAPIAVFIQKIDGTWVSAYVPFAGLAPGYSGLYQVNVQIPNDAASGNQVSLYIQAGGAQSNRVQISVQ